MFQSFFESSIFRTIRNYTIFLTFLNIPHLLNALFAKEKFSLEVVGRGSGFMFSVQVSFLRWIIDQIGLLLGQKSLYLDFAKFLSGSFSVSVVAAIFTIFGIILTLLIIYLSIKLFGRFVPVLASLNTHHRPTPWSMLYLLFFLLYIFISITN